MGGALEPEPFRIDIRFDAQGFVVVKTEGLINDRALASLFAASAEAAQKYGCTHFFLDHRGSRLQLETVEIYEVPARLQRHLMGYRTALVFSKIGDDESFLEVVCANRGVTAKVFTDAVRAVTWLMER